jgi:hypothetical protein
LRKNTDNVFVVADGVKSRNAFLGPDIPTPAIRYADNPGAKIGKLFDVAILTPVFVHDASIILLEYFRVFTRESSSSKPFGASVDG